MDGNVLVVGADSRFPDALERLLPGVRVRSAATAADTAGLDVDVIVIAGQHPIEHLTEVGVHPNLYACPVVLYCPGHRMREQDWSSVDVWPVTIDGYDAVEEITERVARLLARDRHPAGTGVRAGRSAA